MIKVKNNRRNKKVAAKSIIKKTLSIILIIAFGINSFAAAVSDNDGSAFITKSEFDSLKNDFQSQIDNYNTSIDSKIDEAIAAYLSGIRIAKESQVNILNYTKDGIIAARKMEDIKWSEGSIKFTGWGTTSNLYTGPALTSGNAGGYWTFNGITPTNFKELLVSDVDYTNGKAIWNGWAYTKNTISFSGYAWNANTMGTAITSSPDYATIVGFWRISNTKMATYSGTGFSLYIMDSNNSSALGSGSAEIQVKGANMILDRVIVDDKYYNKDVISVPKENRIFGFTNKDEFRDWCNDWVKLYDQTTAQKQLPHSSVNYWTGTGSGSGTLKRQVDSKFNQYSVTLQQSTWTLSTYAYPKAQWTENASYLGFFKPYVGFVQSLDEWKKIGTKAYDGVIEDMLEVQPDLNYITTKSGDKHLSVAAGYPFIYAKKAQKITIPIDFKQNANFDLWFKVGSFSNDEEVTDSNAKDRITKIKGKNITTSTRANAVRLTGGTGSVEFEMPKDGYVFFKWSLATSTTLGGGTFYPDKTVKVTET